MINQTDLTARLVGDAGVRTAAGSWKPTPTAAPIACVFWAMRPQGSPLPAVVLHVVSGVPGYLMAGGDDGLPDVVVQVDCWGATYSAAKALADAVEAAVGGYRDTTLLGIFVLSRTDDSEPADGGQPAIFRTRLDVRLWANAS